MNIKSLFYLGIGLTAFIIAIRWLERRRSNRSADVLNSASQIGRAAIRTDGRTNNWVAISTVITALAAVVSSLISYKSLAVVEGQLTEMQSGSVDTHTFATAASRSADTAQQAMTSSVRAWLGAVNATFIDLAPGKPLKFRVDYSNFGREPAFDVFYDANVYTLNKDGVGHGSGQLFDVEFCKSKAELGHLVIYPTQGNSYFFTKATGEKGVPTVLPDEAISSGNILLIKGCFKYRTQQQVKFSAFCMYYKQNETDPNRINLCPIENSAD